MIKYFSIGLMLVLLTSFTMVQKKQRVVFFGDSITQAGVQPGGYISVLNELLKEKGQAANYELVGAGIGGNKVYDLYLRMENDVLSKKTRRGSDLGGRKRCVA